ncbi:MAG TPA: hypothetical protein VNJ03_13530 [Vicinamibacterales bacterium]|nr:hypothetical protein [Vicinamibacterales bacterium]
MNVLAFLLLVVGLQRPGVETLRSVSALPAHIAGSFEEIAACHISPEHDYLVFDRRSHVVSRVARDGSGGVREVVQIGIEPGRILRPSAFVSAPDGTFVVADAPVGVERIQIFSYLGPRIGGFTLRGRAAPRVTLGNLVLNGVGSIDYTGTTILVNDSENGALITEHGLDGAILRTFGRLRATGQEADRELHLALNSGYPLAIPGGGFYFVFMTGVPVFRKYDASGAMLYERHVEGPEVDEYLRALPSKWPRRTGAAGEHPLVSPSFRTAAVDPKGSLWISLMAPVSYVYDSGGEKRRTLQFRGAGVFSPTDFFFAREGRVIASPGCYAFDIK